LAVFLVNLWVSIPVAWSGEAGSPTPVRFGAYEFPPYVLPDGSGITSAFANLLNRVQSDYRFSVVTTSPQRRYEDLENGRFDAVAFESSQWGWQGRPVDATRVFLRDGEVFVARAGPGIDQTYFDDLSGKRILGRLGYHYAFAGYDASPEVLEQRYNTRVTVTHEGNVRSVAAGRANLAIVTRSFLTQFLHAEPALATQLVVSARMDQVYEHTIIVGRAGPITAGHLNALLDDLEKRNLLAQLWAECGIAE